ncbi:hypothetical protein BCIN_15g05300 [Botrytis cinerea B05.10]|uniref:Uncharacterized protein n=1 Tax=Botryotinia fuckeliana (strain B05.10) TaxID=332648 RepID=A0A384K5G7_BOTFB|nr:hypothetical protein BCIN_15g05300 [Botrytis cinerea B05.10]ATZ58070.1 hypothetical protein BCIN_15g05300 [Botrytis cinerea B05.10]
MNDILTPQKLTLDHFMCSQSDRNLFTLRRYPLIWGCDT